MANCVRCDIAYAVGCLARYAMISRHAHVKAAKGVDKYLSMQLASLSTEIWSLLKVLVTK
jgi:hypothetical protein